jgi:ferrous iron transport protein A
MRLSGAKIGRKYIVTDVRLPEELTRRLEVLGLTRGVGVSVMEMKKRGAMVIKFRNTRFAIGRQAADGIFVGGQNER